MDYRSIQDIADEVDAAFEDERGYDDPGTTQRTTAMVAQNTRDILNQVFAGRDSSWVKQWPAALDRLGLHRKTAVWVDSERHWALVLLQRQAPGEGFDLGNFSMSGITLSRLLDAEAAHRDDPRPTQCYLATVESIAESSEVLSYARIGEVVQRINDAGVEPFVNTSTHEEYYWFDRDLQPLFGTGSGGRTRFRGSDTPPGFLF